MNDSPVNRVIGTATNKVPSVVKIFVASTEGVSYGCLENSKCKFLKGVPCDPVDIFKLARYIFPNKDPEPTEAGKTEVSDLKCLEYVVNLAGHRLNLDLKHHWDELCSRDTSFPEITSNGIIATQFDLKQEIGLYKKAKEKERYVTQMSGRGDQATTILETNLCPAQELSWNRVKMRTQDSEDTCEKNVESGVPIFKWPTNGPLPEMVDCWEKNGLSVLDGLNELIQKRKYEKERNTLLEVLKQIKRNFIHKKSRKKVDRFIKIVESHKEISLKKITFFVYWVQRILKNIQKRSKELNIRNFESHEESTNCIDNCHKSGKCPELIVKRRGDTNITSILLDTGAESNILDVDTMEQVLKVSRDEVSPLDYQLSLRGSTGLKLNAILGQVTICLSFLLETSQVQENFENHKWISSTITFLVADSTVQLKHIILGIPFMRKHRVSLHFAPRPKVSAVISDTPNGSMSRVHLKLKSNKVKLHLSRPVKIGDETAVFTMSNLAVENDYILSLKNDTALQLPSHIVFSGYLQNNGEESLSLQKNILLPVWTENECANVTLIAEVFQIPQTSEQKVHNSECFTNVVTSSTAGPGDSHDQGNRNESHRASQSTYNIIQDTDKAEIEKLNNLKYMCNLACLPLGDQQKILGSSNDINKNVHVIAVNEIETDSGSKEGPEIEKEVNLCKICNVFSNKCECSILCSVCNEMRSNKILCKCDRQHVKLLATKIGKSMTGGLEEQNDQVNYIPNSEQVGFLMSSTVIWIR